MITENTTSLLDLVKTPRDLHGINLKTWPSPRVASRGYKCSLSNRRAFRCWAGCSRANDCTSLYLQNEDRLIWDVGPGMHEIDWWRDRIKTFGKLEGSQVSEEEESEYDPFGRAQLNVHFCRAGYGCCRDLKSEENHVVALIGDGAMSAGMKTTKP